MGNEYVYKGINTGLYECDKCGWLCTDLKTVLDEDSDKELCLCSDCRDE